MYKQLRKLFDLLSRDQRKRLIKLQFLVVLMAFAEVGGVFAIGPFMALVADMNRLSSGGLLTEIYNFTGLSDAVFVFWVGVAVLVALSIAAIISMYTTWKLSSFSFILGAELGARLFKHYMKQSWLFHTNQSSANLVSKIATESGRLTGQVINPVLQLVARSALIIVMSFSILIYNPIVAVAGVGIFSIGYFVLYRTVRKKLLANGKAITNTNRLRMKLMQEGFGGIKDTLLLGRQEIFNERFAKESDSLGRVQGNNAVLAQVPRYAMELLAFGSVILLVLYLLSSYEGNLSLIFPALAVYSLAGFKLLPAFQQVYTSLAGIRGNIAAFENLMEDFELSQEEKDEPETKSLKDINFKSQIVLSQVSFSYPGKKNLALSDINLVVPKNKVIGLVGSSGAGKSTAVDLLLGLIEPQIGKLLVDEVEVNARNKRSWQNKIGYVSQSIFLADSSIRENIAFGLPRQEICEAKVSNAIHLSHLDELISSLPEGLDTQVGERGIQLSGGQRQRIGIARALYSEAEILVFDEATSALDGVTERLVMDAIHDFVGTKTIVLIAHRLATVQNCDCIYLMSKGCIVDSGSYTDLINRNKMFRSMAAQS